jgi:hypothetical protein
MPYHCATCQAVIADYVPAAGALKKHWQVAESKCAGVIVETKAAPVRVQLPEREGKSLPAGAAATVSSTDTHSVTNAMGYRWTGAGWNGPFAGAEGTLKKDAHDAAKKKGVTLSNKHAEQQAYGLMGAAKNFEKKGWFAFVQNAPPCTSECLVFFVNESKKVEAGGFIFKVTADHGAYCKEYQALNDGVIPSPPFEIYVWDGKWGFVAPDAAPSVEFVE